MHVVSYQDRVPFLISSPCTSCCKSRDRLFGATYSAQAASIDRAINVEMTGRFMTLGSDFARGTTERDTRGRPIRVTKVVFTLDYALGKVLCKRIKVRTKAGQE